jgi:hypothetical protein
MKRRLRAEYEWSTTASAVFNYLTSIAASALHQICSTISTANLDYAYMHAVIDPKVGACGKTLPTSAFQSLHDLMDYRQAKVGTGEPTDVVRDTSPAPTFWR